MLGEIGRDFYCADVINFWRNKKPRCELYTNNDCTQLGCVYCHRKWPAPEQFKKEYGEEYPDDGAVWALFKFKRDFDISYAWLPLKFQKAKEYMADAPHFMINMACACTPWGKPPDDWRPE